MNYYAKIIQEKRNYKVSEKELADFLRGNMSRAKQYVRKKTAAKAEEITIYPDTLTAEVEENGKVYLFKFVPDESLGYILRYIGTK